MEIRLHEFRAAFVDAFASGQARARGDALKQPGSVAVRLPPEDRPFDVYRDLLKLEPCGVANPAPDLVLVADLVSAKNVRGGHLKLELELSGQQRVSGFAPLQGELAETLGPRVALRGTLRPDRWRGGQAVEVRVAQIQNASECGA